jgi:hypothetical protein
MSAKTAISFLLVGIVLSNIRARKGYHVRHGTDSNEILTQVFCYSFTCRKTDLAMQLYSFTCRNIALPVEIQSCGGQSANRPPAAS